MKNNKGFSLVELIIVIAIMAILAGALAPALIKYINKSRRSTDVANADTIRNALQTAMSDEDAANALSTAINSVSITTVKNRNDAYGKEVKSILGDTRLTTKYASKGKDFKVSVDPANNVVRVFADNNDQICPSATGSYK